MNAIELLKADHDVVEDLLDKVKAAKESEHPMIFSRIKAELEVHMHIEETVFYPKLEEEGDEDLVEIVREGVEEHRQIKMFLSELDCLSEDSEKFEPKLKVLMEDVEHHVEEEEGEMFPLIEDQFDADTLDELGAALEAEKMAVKEELSATAGR